MSWTKRDYINQAYSSIGYASYAYDLEPEQIQQALVRLDAMLVKWAAKGIRLGWPAPSSPRDSDLDTETNTPDWANEAIYTNLAMQLAPTVGKQVSPETRQAARDSYRTLLLSIEQPDEKQFPDTMPRGAGNRTWNNDYPFTPPPADYLQVGRDGDLDVEV